MSTTDTERAPVRVLIADDHRVFAEALELLLRRDARFVVVGTAGDGAEAIDLAVIHAADVVLMDLDMPVMNGFVATKKLLALRPNARVIALSGLDEAVARADALDAGAVGYLTKGGIGDEVAAAIVAAAA